MALCQKVYLICITMVMKRYHQNFSNEPMTFRTWMLMVDSVDESDFLWLKAFDIPIRIEAPEHKFDTVNGATYTVYAKPTYTLDTQTDKQRDMIVLKYGNTAMLIQEEIVSGQGMCTLSEIKW